MLPFLIFQAGQISSMIQTRENLECQGDADINILFHKTSAMTVIKQSMCLYRYEKAVSLWTYFSFF